MLGDKWKALSASERKPYDEKAAADKKRYEEEKAKYQAVSPGIIPVNHYGLPTHTHRVAMTRRSRPKQIAARPSPSCAAAGVCVSY